MDYGLLNKVKKAMEQSFIYVKGKPYSVNICHVKIENYVDTCFVSATFHLFNDFVYSGKDFEVDLIVSSDQMVNPQFTNTPNHQSNY